MSSLEDLLGKDEVPLSRLLKQRNQEMTLPEATLRNRAAVSALQAAPDEMVGTYQEMLGEGGEEAYEELSSRLDEATREMDFSTLMDMLADPELSNEVKGDLVVAFQSSPRLTDKTYALADKALMAESEGENIEQEAVRLSVADEIESYMDHKSILQGLTNQFLIDNKKNFLQSTVDFASIIVPGTDAYTNISVTKKIYEALGMEYSTGKTLRDALFPGYSALKVRERFLSLSDQEQIETVSKILDAVKESSGIIAGDDNQVRAAMMLGRFLDGDYTSKDVVLDSLFNLLDIVAIGQLAKTAFRAVRPGSYVKRIKEAEAAQETRGVRKTPEYEGATVSPPKMSSRAKEIEDLEMEYSRLLSETQSELDPGSVRNLRSELKSIDEELQSLKKAGTRDRVKQLQSERVSAQEARKQAKAEIDDRVKELEGRRQAVTNRLEINARTSSAEQRLGQIEKQLSAARKDTSTVPIRYNSVMDAIQRISRNSVFGVDNPASAGSILSNMNPDKGRKLYKAIYESQGDELANAAVGMSKTDYLISNISPQVGTDSGKVRAKVADIQRGLEDDLPVSDFGLRFSPAEREHMKNELTKAFENANGLKIHDAEGSLNISTHGDKMRVSAMYGTSEGGFLRAEDAVEQAKLALRQYGIDESNITVMRRNGPDYEPVQLKDVRGVEGDYKIQINTDIEQGVELMGDGWEAFDVYNNFFDRFEGLMFKGAGSVNRMLTDMAANLHPNLSGSLSVSTDVSVTLEKILLTHADQFAKIYNKLPDNRKNKVWDYLLEANHKQLPYDLAQLRAKGFTRDETELLQHFRNFWDMHYQLENLDVVRTLRSHGFQALESTTGDKFFARPLAKNINNNTAYDPTEGLVRQLTREEMDKLYDGGGTIAILKSPVNIEGSRVERIVVRNNPDEYLRRIGDKEQALNYREGYFQINYKAPYFIRKVNEDGTLQAVAVRGDKHSATVEADRLSKTTGDTYRVTGDEKDVNRQFSDVWDLNQMSGRVAQRRRGKPLEGSDGKNIIDGKEFVENPFDSAVRAARSIAGRTVMRPALETAKARALHQYGHLLRKDLYGNPIYPKNIKDIGTVGEYTTKELADARTTFEAINRMEAGYYNIMDDLFKGGMNTIAEAIGDLNVKARGKLSVAEGAAHSARRIKPSGVMRGTAFQAYIGTGFHRQWIMQGQQVLRTIGYNPKAWLTGDMAKYLIGTAFHKLGWKTSKDIEEFVKAFGLTGMSQSVDRSNLVRGAIMEAVDRRNIFTKSVGKATEFTRTIGHDAGEKFNLLGHYAAVWSKYKRRGDDLTDPYVLSKLHSEARAISQDYNVAGDFAYTQNILSVPLQFAQVLHKFLLTPFNRRYSRAERWRMVAGDLILWGIPGTYTVSELIGFDILPEDPEWRERFTEGVTSWGINNLLNAVFKDDPAVSLESTAPYNIGSFIELMKSSITDGWGEMIFNTPSGQLLFKSEGRVGMAFRSLFRHFAPISEGMESPETILDTVNQFAKISSGWNNITKAWAQAQTGIAVDRLNLPTDTNVKLSEAIAQAFGFPTKTTRDYYRTIERTINRKEEVEKVARDIANSIFEMYSVAYSGDSAVDPEYTTRLTGSILHLAKKNPLLAARVYDLIKMRLNDPEDSTMHNILKAINLPTVENLERDIRDSGLPEDKKKQLLDILATRNRIINEDE